MEQHIMLVMKRSLAVAGWAKNLRLREHILNANKTEEYLIDLSPFNSHKMELNS
jgi:hypothetical protein